MRQQVKRTDTTTVGAVCKSLRPHWERKGRTFEVTARDIASTRDTTTTTTTTVTYTHYSDELAQSLTTHPEGYDFLRAMGYLG